MAKMENSSGCKSKVKNIADRVESTLYSYAHLFQEHYIRCFPNQCEESVGIDGSFMGKQMAFLSDMSKMMNDHVFRIGYVEGAECFLEAVGNPPMKEVDFRITNEIAVLHVDQGRTNLFFVLTDTDDFNTMYSAEDAYFDYITERSISPHRELVFSILRCNHEPHRNIVIMVNPDFCYRGKDFCLSGKKYIDKMMSSVTRDIGYSVALGEIEVYPYDFYFKNLRDNLPVDYLIGRLSRIYEQQSIKLNNVGRLLYSDASELIATFAFASNNYVGTQYRSATIQRIDSSYRSLRKPRYVDQPLYVTSRYKKMFESISEIASSNLFILEDPRISKPLLTAEWLYNNVGDVAGFDNTFICFGYLKLVEILLASILLKYYSGCCISISKNNYITISEYTESQLMLGNMVRFLTHSTDSALYQSPFSSIVANAISEWTHEIRNGYFHKHTMEREKVDSIRNKTFEIVYMLLGTVIPQTEQR